MYVGKVEKQRSPVYKFYVNFKIQESYIRDLEALIGGPPKPRHAYKQERHT